MFTQMRIFNLKFLGAILFTILFFMGGFFMNTVESEASSTVQSFGVSYSISPVVSTTNSDGSVTTRIFVGCAPQSGHIYDINTGRLCNNYKQTGFVGCKIGSGDIFDVYTGIRCDSYIKPVLIGCGIKSGHIYDINTGKLCTNNTSIPIVKKIDTNTPNISILNPAKQIEEISTLAKEPLEEINNGENDTLSGREILINSLSASAGKIGFVLRGPMLIWIIILIILILLGGGYGVYSLYKKDKDVEIKKVEVKETPKPITPVTNTPKQETLPINNPVPPASNGTGPNNIAK